MFGSVLIANRGEIAARIIRTLKRLGIEAIGIASDSDRFTLPMRMADRVMRLGPMKWSPSAAKRSAKAAFSERKP